jgi:hypothetical protein
MNPLNNPKHISELATAVMSGIKPMETGSAPSSAEPEPKPLSYREAVDRKKAQILRSEQKPRTEADVSREAHLEILLERLQNHPEFSKSKPEINREWWFSTTHGMQIEFIRAQLIDMHNWLMDNPDRLKKNYRRFIGNWLRGESKNAHSKKGYKNG